MLTVHLTQSADSLFKSQSQNLLIRQIGGKRQTARGLAGKVAGEVAER